VRINLNNLNDSEFVGWKTDEMDSLMNTSRMMLEEIQGIVADKLKHD
jgi:formiminotetrahydrofolate cyclodeaminase